MEPGRKMDALIHQVIHDRQVGVEYCRFVDGDYQVSMGYPLGHESPPRYSTMMDAAMIAFKWMHETGTVVLSNGDGDSFDCDWIPAVDDYKPAFARAMNGFVCRSFAHAVCTALLLGVGVFEVVKE